MPTPFATTNRLTITDTDARRKRAEEQKRLEIGRNVPGTGGAGPNAKPISGATETGVQSNARGDVLSPQVASYRDFANSSGRSERGARPAQTGDGWNRANDLAHGGSDLDKLERGQEAQGLVNRLRAEASPSSGGYDSTVAPGLRPGAAPAQPLMPMRDRLAGTHSWDDPLGGQIAFNRGRQAVAAVQQQYAQDNAPASITSAERLANGGIGIQTPYGSASVTNSATPTATPAGATFFDPMLHKTVGAGDFFQQKADAGIANRFATQSNDYAGHAPQPGFQRPAFRDRIPLGRESTPQEIAALEAANAPLNVADGNLDLGNQVNTAAPGADLGNWWDGAQPHNSRGVWGDLKAGGTPDTSRLPLPPPVDPYEAVSKSLPKAKGIKEAVRNHIIRKSVRDKILWDKAYNGARDLYHKGLEWFAGD